MAESVENEWELSKENVLPLKQGRRISNLTAGLQPSVDQASKIKQQRTAFETELRMYDGEDPLDVWVRYINWTEQTFPKGGKESHFRDILQRCVTAYKEDEKYQNDTRYIGIWIKFANICNDASELYSYLFDQKIGYKLASFYEAWASELERLGKTQKADWIYTQGIQNGAEPLDFLMKKHYEFQARVSRRIAGEVVAPPDPVTEVQEPIRLPLGSLKGHGSKAKVTADRSATSISGGLRLAQGPRSSNTIGPGFQVATDENVDPSELQTLQPTGEYRSIPSDNTNKENTMKPDVWSKAKMKQKHQPVVKFDELSTLSKPEFSVHTEADQPMITPRKMNPLIDQALSARKPEKDEDPLYQVQHCTDNIDPNQRPMYCRSKIYAGADEFQFEELRAAHWVERKRKQEEILAREKDERQKMELQRQIEEMRLLMEQERERRLVMEHEHEKLRQEMQLIKLQDMRSKNAPETRAVPNRKSQEFSKFRGQAGNVTLPVLEMSMDTTANLLAASSQDRSSSLINSSNAIDLTLNSTGSTGKLHEGVRFGPVTAEQSRANVSNITLNSTGSTGKLHEGVRFGPVTAEQSRASISNVTPTMNNKLFNMTGSAGSRQGFPSNMVTPRTGNFAFNTSGSAGSIRAPTPDSNQLGAFGGKLTAPSPTINTKQALSTVLGLFNDTMDIHNQFGWDPIPEEDPLEKMFAKGGNQNPAVSAFSGPAFTIFDENAVNTPATTTPLTIYEDKENSVPKPSKATAAQANFPRKGLGPRSVGLTPRDSVSSEPTPQPHEAMETDSKPSCLTFSQEYHLPMPVSEDVDMDEPVLASQKMLLWDREEIGMDAIENMPSEMTFAPGFSSTCNFTEAARLASTPFNSAGNNYFPEPPVSHIKGPTGPADHTSELTSTDESTNSASMFGRRTNPQTDLSPIIERSDEDVKSHASTIAAEDPPNNTVHALTGHTGPASALFSQTFTMSKTPRLAESLRTINEESSCVQNDANTNDEKLENMTCHEIDMTNYIAPKADGNMTRILDMSVVIDDPNDPFDADVIDGFLNRLAQPLSDQANYHQISDTIPEIIPGQSVQLGKHTYNVIRLLGAGGFAKIFIVQRTERGKRHNLEVLKFQKPACPWEFYICLELRERLSKPGFLLDVRSSIMSINEGYFFIDGSCMTNTIHEYGTLLNLVNIFKDPTEKLGEAVRMLLILDLITLFEHIHKCHIIHGDVKPDNLLVSHIPRVNDQTLKEFLRSRKLCFKLIDFGQSIDMKMYPENTTFTAIVLTDCFQCIEMKTQRPWTYQTDLFGLIGCIHVIIFDQYMNLRQLRGVWKATSSFTRRKYFGDVLQDMFNDLLNIPSCDELPDLSVYREKLEKIFIDNFNPSRTDLALQHLQEVLEAKKLSSNAIRKT